MDQQRYWDGCLLDGGQTLLYDSSTTYYNDSSRTNRTVKVGQTYYIKVMPGGADGGGTYQIAFSASVRAPPATVTLPASATKINFNSWEHGNITSPNGQQWFKFDAIAADQYIHVDFSTLTSLYVQVYDSTGNPIGSQTILSGRTTCAPQEGLTTRQTYYVKVWPYSGSGLYLITYNSLPITVINSKTLGNGVLTDGYGEQWYTYTANGDMLRIRASLPGGSLNVVIYDSRGNPLGSKTVSGSDNGYSINTDIPSTGGQTYYIKVNPSGDGFGYSIALSG